MIKFKLAAASLVLGFLTASGAAQALPIAKAPAGVQTASVDVVPARYRGPPPHFRGRPFAPRYHRWHHRYGRPGIYFYGGGGGCGWLHDRAVYSGSRYWWRRYNACRYGW